MSEQVKRYDGQMMLGGTAIAAGFKTGMVTGRDYDALHAEAEALRAENGRLAESLRVAHHNLSVGFDTEASLTSQLEASRGLLEAARRIDCEAGQHGTANVSMGAFKALEHSIARLDALAATPAPEVRQEAKTVCMGCVDQASRIRELEHKMDYYTTPQPGPDVRGLVEALEHYANCGKSGNVARVALASHRQAQRKGDSHDT